MKTLYLLTSDGGDGSRSIHYTFDGAFVQRLDDNSDQADYDALGMDGDGFGYDTLTVPDECTYESLGISNCAEGYEFEDEEEDEE